MLPDRVSNPGPLTYESGALPIALRGPADRVVNKLALTIMYGWMKCDLTSFSTVFESYKYDGRMMMRGCVQPNPVYG